MTAASRCSRPSVRTAIRYYIWTEAGGGRLSARLHAALVLGEIALKSLANSHQQIVEVFVRRLGIRRVLVKARGVYYSFDARGYLVVGSAVDAMAIGAIPARQFGQNIADIGPKLRQRQWIREHTWKPARSIVHQISDDVNGVRRIPSWKP